MSDPTAPDASYQPPRPRIVRGFVGHIESLGTPFRAVAESLAGQPELDPDGWGSAYAADPWPRPLPADLPASTYARLRQHYQAQHPERVRALTFVTRSSRSLVTLEDHAGALVLAITYDARPDAADVVAATPTTEPTAHASDLPADAPADVRAAVRGFLFAGATTLAEQLFAAGPGRPAASDRVTLLLGLAAVWHDDLRLAETVRRIARLQVGDWALRAAGIAVARRQGYQLLLHELWAAETDPELHAELTTVLTGEPASAAEEAVT